MLPSLEYTNTLANGIVQYTKNADNKIQKDVDTKIKDNTPDWEQNDPEGKGFIKNRPFYTKPESYTKLGNTYNDWLKLAGGTPTNVVLSFWVDGKIYEKITPRVVSDSSFYYYIYDFPDNTPSVGVNTRTYTISGSYKEFYFVSIEPPKIHYLDPKYIEDMYYTEPESYEKIGNTYDDWDKLCNDDRFKPLSFLIDGEVYKDVTPRQLSNYTHVYDFQDGAIAVVVYPNTHTISLNGGEEFSFISIIEEEVHKIPEKYYDKYEPFFFELTQHDDGTYTTNRIWDEVKKALDGGVTQNDFFLKRGFLTLSCINISTQESSGAITAYQFDFKYNSDEYTEDTSLLTTTHLKQLNNYIQIFSILITKSGSTVSLLEGTPGDVYGTGIWVGTDTSGELYCGPSNAVDYCMNFLRMPSRNVSCPLLYNDEIYNFESSDDDSVYFSAVIDGIYRRIKITRGEDGAADTVTIDKEYLLENSKNRVSEITDENSQAITAYPNVAAVKSYVDEKVQSVVSFDSEVVDELPETGVKGVVYFVPHTHLWSNDSYDEYMWTGEKFEKIGNTDIDLSNYVKKDELPTSLKNPNALTVKIGEETNTYDGSEAVTIEIPEGTSDNSLNVTGATVGQTVKIASVDDNGVPTAWVPVDMASGGVPSLMDLVESRTLADGESVANFITGNYPDAKEAFIHLKSFTTPKTGEAATTASIVRPFWADGSSYYGRLGGDVNNSAGTTTDARHIYIYLQRISAEMVIGKMFAPPNIASWSNVMGEIQGTGIPRVKLSIINDDRTYEAGTILEVWVR